MKFLSNYHIRYFFGGYINLPQTWKDYGVKINDAKLFYITDGELILRINGKEHIFKKGEVVLVPPKVKHDYYLSEKYYCRKFWLHFSLSFGETEFFSQYDLPLSQPSNRNTATYFKNATMAGGDEVTEFTRSAAILNIMADFIRSSNPKRKNTSTVITQSLAYISDNLTDNITLKALSKRAYLSQSYFLRKFKKETGTTPMQALKKARVEKAKELLTQTSLSVSEIMTSVGIYDAAYFSKLIKSSTGYSPRAFRDIFKRS